MMKLLLGLVVPVFLATANGWASVYLEIRDGNAGDIGPTLNAVPEPTTVLLVGLSLLAALALRWRK